MGKYAKGKHAWGICDRTGFRYKLSDLVYEYDATGRRTGLRVGRDQVDQANPQEDNKARRVDESIGLFDPRPDTTVESLWGWNPVGNPASYLKFSVGTVRVTTS